MENILKLALSQIFRPACAMFVGKFMDKFYEVHGELL
jgi:hypothetical protein